MQRTTLVAAGLLVVLGIGALVLGRGAGSKSHPTSASASAAPSALVAAPASAAPLASVSAASALAEDEDTETATGWDTLPDGRHVPELPASAPSTVSFGVVLFTYAGAQAAPDSARTKEAAKQRAESAIEEAKRDFKAAVAKGDRGSTADAGRIPRGVLEPAVEYVLFTLEKGAVHSEPVDTPRGYWVVRRIN
jgi:parvulin-like peptidyl-prolyl isomerase